MCNKWEAGVDDGSTAMTMSERETDLTTEFPNVKSGGGEVVVLVAQP